MSIPSRSRRLAGRLVPLLRNRRPRRARLPHAIRSSVTSLLVLSLLLVGPGTTPALAQAATGDLQAERARFERFDRGLAQLEEALPDGYWDAGDLAFDLAFETPETIAAWVRDEIAYEPYRGLLRGPDGTLQAGAGNALDQAVLLARLLNDAGYSARIARATLPEAAAADLVATMTDRAPAEVSDPAREEEVYDALGATPDAVEALAADALATEAALRDRASDTTRWLDGLLAGAGIEVRSDDLADALDEARDYAWVEYRLADADPWARAHPVAPEGAGWTEGLEATEILEGDVPADLQHRFRFRAVIERRLGDELEVEPVMGAWERPVANMNGVALTYSSTPDGFMQDGVLQGTVQEAQEATEFVVPILNGTLAPGGQVFDLLGNTVDPAAAASSAAGVFQSVGGMFGEATSALSGQEDAVALTAHWLEFTLIAPGGEETTHRRMIVDRIGAERRRTGDVSGPLKPMTDAEIYERMQATHTFMLSPGRYSRGYVEERALEALELTTDYLEQLAVARVEGATSVAEPPADLGTAPTAVALLNLFRTFDGRAAAAQNVRTYRPAPALVVHTASWTQPGTRADIVHNPRRSFATAPGAAAPSPDPTTTLASGVWETTVERLLLAGADEVYDTHAFFERVREEAVPVEVLPPGDTSALEAIALPPESREAMRRDLERGYAVVTAQAMPASASVPAWWRVDPATGETLGRGADGRGNSMSYATLLQVGGFMMGGFLGIAGFGACMGTGGAFVCCAGDGVAGFVAGLLLGLLMAKVGIGGLVSFGAGATVDAGVAISGAFEVFPWSFCNLTSSAPTGPGTTVADGGRCVPPAGFSAVAFGSPERPASIFVAGAVSTS